MSAIQTLTDNIKTRTLAVLGAGYSEAAYGIDFLKNTKFGTQNVYAVLPLGLENVATVTKSVTYDQTFSVRIAKTYINLSMGDATQQTAAISLLESAKDLYLDLVDTKCGSPAICLNTTDLDVQNPEHAPESKMVVVIMNFVVKYRELI